MISKSELDEPIKSCTVRVYKDKDLVEISHPDIPCKFCLSKQEARWLAQRLIRWLDYVGEGETDG